MKSKNLYDSEHDSGYDPGHDPGPKKVKESSNEKGTRGLRTISNKKTSEYVVKTTLNSSLIKQENSDVRKNLLESIDKRVKAMSKGYQRLSLAMNLMIKDFVSEKTNPLDIELPVFLSCPKNATFAIQLITGLEKSTKPVEFIEKFLNKKLLLYNKTLEQYEEKSMDDILPKCQERFYGDTNIIIRAAEQYITNYKTYLETTFAKKQNKFLKLWCTRHEINSDANVIKYLINGWNHRQSYVANYEVTKLVEFQRKLLGLSNEEDIIDKSWIKSNYEKIIIYYSVLSKYLIKHSSPGIVTAPLARMRTTFIQIDTRVFHGILKELNLVNINEKELKNNQKLHWDSIFDTDKFLTKNQKINCKFTFTIQTNS